MSFLDVRNRLTDRLNEGGRGDKGWYLITRVHLSAARLQKIVAYLFDLGGSGPIALGELEYQGLGKLLEIDGKNPAQTINRHYFLAMDTPLRLIRRTSSRSWSTIQLTSAGVALATSNDATSVFDQQLQEFRFCEQPWYTAQRVSEYSEFDVLPYSAAIAVISGCGGVIDLDEFDLFLSRVRSSGEIPTCIGDINNFRGFSDTEKQELRNLVAARVPAGEGADPHKRYNNWRDMARHTFSLLSLGSQLQRVDNRLYLTTAVIVDPPAPGGGAVQGLGPKPQVLKIPDGTHDEDLLIPPPPPETNNGAEAELLVGKLFSAAGWSVVYYNKRRGYGFDLWVRKDEQAFVVEVKSFVGQGSSVTLTATEHLAAAHHKENFLLVVVEGAATASPQIHVIQDPVAKLSFTPANTASFAAARGSWFPAAEALTA